MPSRPGLEPTIGSREALESLWSSRAERPVEGPGLPRPRRATRRWALGVAGAWIPIVRLVAAPASQLARKDRLPVVPVGDLRQRVPLGAHAGWVASPHGGDPERRRGSDNVDRTQPGRTFGEGAVAAPAQGCGAG